MRCVLHRWGRWCPVRCEQHGPLELSLWWQHRSCTRCGRTQSRAALRAAPQKEMTP